MKKYEFSFNINWVYDKPVENHHILLRCLPGTYSFQRAYASALSITPNTVLTRAYDGYANQTQSGVIVKPHSGLSVATTGFVLCSRYVIHEPADPIYRYPSFKTEPDADMREFLDKIDLPEDSFEKALKLTEIVGHYMAYEPGSTKFETNAHLAFMLKKGVSRDFVQVYLTLCRLAGLPARYVIGLARGVSRIHVWAEVYCRSAWYAFDPTMGTAVEEGHIKIAHGLDSSGCAVNRFFWDSETAEVGQVKTVNVKVSEHTAVRDPIPK